MTEVIEDLAVLIGSNCTAALQAEIVGPRFPGSRRATRLLGTACCFL